MQDKAALLHDICDNFSEALHDLIELANAPEDEAITTDLVEALDRFDLYLSDEAKSFRYYYRLLIAKSPKYRELLEEYYKEVVGKPYKPDFVASEEEGHIFIVPLDK